MIKVLEPTGLGGKLTKYVYDNNGNTLQRTKETTKKADPLEKPSFSMFIIGQTDNEFSRSMVINEYDLFNQLVTTKSGAQISNYVYNGEGRRVQKNVNGQTTNYLYEYDKVVLETDGKGKQTARNVYGINLLSRTIDSQKVNYLYNGHADVTALIDETGTKVASYYYDAFGNPLETTGTILNPIRYAGYQYDTETGLYYLNERYYDSKIARFLTEDTFRGQDNDPLSLNLYTYCHNEPIMYSDPTGHRAETLGSKTRNDNAVFKLKKQVKADYVKATKVVKTVVKAVVKPVVKTVVKPVVKTVVKPVVKTVVKPVVKTVVKPIVNTVIKPVVKTVVKPIVNTVIKTVVNTVLKPTPNSPKPGNISKNTEDSGRNIKNINDNEGTGNNGTSLWSDVKDVFKEIFSPAKTEEGQVAFALALSSSFSRQIDMDIADFEAESSNIYVEDDIDIESPITIKGNKLVNSNITSEETVSSVTETNFYVTPKGDVIPATEEGFNSNLSKMTNNNGKYVGESSNGPVRVRVEDGHLGKLGFSGQENIDHEIPHVHIEYRQNGATGPWGSNKTTFPQDWLK